LLNYYVKKKIFKFKRRVAMSNNIHICNGCGQIKEGSGHLCDPMEITQAYVCEHCGSSTKEPRHMCKPKLQNINFLCIACGRVAELPKQLCNPRDIVLMAKGDPPEKIF
jgi:hypothetical protein